MKFIFPTILIGIAIAGFFIFANPIYKEVKELRIQQNSYDDALMNARELKERSDELLTKYNNFAPADLSRLRKMMPDHADNIRLTIEVESLAASHGIILRDVSFEVDQDETERRNAVADVSLVTTGGPIADSREYESLDVTFTMEGDYEQFTAFLKDLEKSLRILDIVSLSFESATDDLAGAGVTSPAVGYYEYELSTRTYWLKD